MRPTPRRSRYGQRPVDTSATRGAKSDTSSSVLRQRLRDLGGRVDKELCNGSVRVFRVKIPIGKRVGGSSTGKTLHSSRFLGNRNVESANIVRWRSVERLNHAFP